MNKTIEEINLRNNGDSCRLLSREIKVCDDQRISGLNGHDIIVGGSGASKTGGYVVPNMLTCDHSMVIVDTKSFLNRRYKNYLKSKGFKVVVYDFVNPEKSAVYNMLEYIRTYRKNKKLCYSQKDVRYLVNTLIPENLSNDDKFWIVCSRMVVTCLIAYVMEVFDKKDRNMFTVAKIYKTLVNELSYNYNEIPIFEELREVNPTSFAVECYDTFRKVAMAPKTWACIMQFVAAGLDPFMYEDFRQAFGGKNTIKFTDLGKEKIAMFVNVSDIDRSMDAVLGIFYSQLFKSLIYDADSNHNSRLAIPVRIFMDDFATNFKIPDFDKIISVVRSREIYISLVMQSINQLETFYTHAQAKTIINNCDCKIFLGNQEIETAQYISELAGCLPQTIMKLEPNQSWVIIRGYTPILTERIEPYSMDKEIGLEN